MILVDLERVTATRPGRALFQDLSLTISDTDRIGIVGINGTGKSTLLRVLTGSEEPESGVIRRGRGVRISDLLQTPSFEAATLREALTGAMSNASSAAVVSETPTDGALGELPSASLSMPGDAAPPNGDLSAGDLSDGDLVGSGGWGGDGHWESIAIADRLGLSPLFDVPIGELSGGQLKRAALAQVLVAPADLLILDEPTNHLDIDAIAWLEDRLAEHRGGLVLVTHDRHFLDRVTNRIIELDRGRAFIHEGGYGSYLEDKARRQELAAVTEQKRKNLARTELAWLRRGAPARTSKPKARLESARQTITARPEADARLGRLPLHSKVPRLGDKVIELRGVSAGHPGQRPLFERFDLLLDNRERLGIVGPNGTGKSTLLDLMAGRIPPLAGTVEVGSTVRVGYYDQRGRELDLRQRVRDAVAGDKGEVDWTDKALMEAFWFDGDAQWAPIELLSGGERRRLQLLLTLAEKPNVLLLDEPTNDLDLDTLRELEDFLDDWPGALVVVSHDRAFLERTVTDVVVLDGMSGIGRLPGGYAAYEQERRSQRNRHRVAGGALGETKMSRADRYKGSDRSPGPGGSSRPSPSTIRFKLKASDKELKAAQRVLAELRSEFESALDDHVRLAEIASRVADAERDLERIEEAWLELAATAEELGLRV